MRDLSGKLFCSGAVKSEEATSPTSTTPTEDSSRMTLSHRKHRVHLPKLVPKDMKMAWPLILAQMPMMFA